MGVILHVQLFAVKSAYGRKGNHHWRYQQPQPKDRKRACHRQANVLELSAATNGKRKQVPHNACKPPLPNRLPTTPLVSNRGWTSNVENPTNARPLPRKRSANTDRAVDRALPAIDEEDSEDEPSASPPLSARRRDGCSATRGEI